MNQNVRIDDIILVGGSIKIPKILSLLKEFFPGKDIENNNGLNLNIKY